MMPLLLESDTQCPTRFSPCLYDLTEAALRSVLALSRSNAELHLNRSPPSRATHVKERRAVRQGQTGKVGSAPR